MPDVYPDPRESAPAPAGGALVASAPAPGREYGPDGLYIHGPQRARPPLVRLIAEPVNPPSAPTPAVARGQMAERRRRAKRSVAKRPPESRFLAAAARGWEAGLRNRRSA